MPKVKFTTLVSEVKGKSNGSVFASNAGGSYFRTNKTGGGKKSADWNKNKNKFADLSTAWKSLTTIQKQAWQDARTLYPTTNAFGEVRIPTSFELYMRLNGTLNAAGLPTLLTPNTPRNMPQASSVELAIPSETVYAPSRLVQLKSPQGTLGNMWIDMTSQTINSNVWRHNSMRFVFPTNALQNMPIGKICGLFYSYNYNFGTNTLFFQKSSSTTLSFYLTQQYLNANQTERTWIMKFDVPIADLQNQIHVFVRHQNEAVYSSQLWINGAEYPIVVTGWNSTQSLDPAELIIASQDVTSAPGGSSLQVLTQVACVIGGTAVDYQYPFLLTDFRYYIGNPFLEACDQINQCEDPYNCIDGWCSVRNNIPVTRYSSTPCVNNSCPVGQTCVDGYCVQDYQLRYLFTPVGVAKIFHGYILNSENILIAFNEIQTGNFPNKGYDFPNITCYFDISANTGGCTSCTENLFSCVSNHCIYVGSYQNLSAPNTLTVGPLASLPEVNIAGEDFYLQIYFTKAISQGKSIEQVPYVLVGTYPISAIGINISARLLELQGNFANNAFSAFKCKVLDASTGVVFSTDLPMAFPVGNTLKFLSSPVIPPQV